jgi:hypothetical protein
VLRLDFPTFRDLSLRPLRAVLLLKRQAGTKKTDRNKIQEISGAPLTEQTIVVVALFPFAGRGWMQKKPFERVFQTLRARF